MPPGGLASGGGGWCLWDSSGHHPVEPGLRFRQHQGNEWEESRVSALAAPGCFCRCRPVPEFLSPGPADKPPCQVPLLHQGHSSRRQGCSWPANRTSYQNPQAAGFNFCLGRAERGRQGRLSKLLLREEWSTGGQRVWDRCLAGSQVELGKHSPTIDTTEKSAQMWMLLAYTHCVTRGDFFSVFVLWCASQWNSLMSIAYS